MRLFRSVTSDQNANTYVGPFGEIIVTDDLQLRIQDNTTPGGITVSSNTGNVTFSGNVIGITGGNNIYVSSDIVPNDSFAQYSLGKIGQPWLSLFTLSVRGSNLNIISGPSTWYFSPTGETGFPNYVFPAADGTAGQVITTDGAGTLSWGAGGGGGVTQSATPPAGPTSQTLWYDTNTGRLYVYYQSVWVDAAPALAGPTGPTGPAGGPTGPTGPAGGGNGNVSTGDITFNGNIIGSTNGNIVIDTALVPSGNATIDLGTIDNQWRSLYVSSNTIYLGGVPLTTDGNTLVVNGAAVATTGNITFADTTLGTANIDSNINIQTVGTTYATHQGAYIDFNLSPASQSVSMSPGFAVGSDAFSMQFWIYRRDVAQWSPIFSYLNGSTAAPFLYFDDSNNLVFDPYYMVLPVTMNANQWYHVAIARDASGNMNAWLDGAQITGGTIGSAVLSNQALGPMTELAYLWYGPTYAAAAIGAVQVVVGNNVFDPTASSITVPTTEPSVVPGTVLLLCTSWQAEYAFDDISGYQTITNNNGTPAYGESVPVSNVTVTGSANQTWSFSNTAVLTLPQSGMITADGNEGIMINAPWQLDINSGWNEEYGPGSININSADALPTASGNVVWGGFVNLNAGQALYGGEGGIINLYGGNGSSNLATGQNGAGGSVWMFGGNGVQYRAGVEITNITLGSPIAITAPSNQVTEFQKININGIVGTTELNDHSYYVRKNGNDILYLYSDRYGDIPVDGAGMTPYVSGGFIYASSSGGGIRMIPGGPSDSNQGDYGTIDLVGNAHVYSIEPMNGSDPLWVRSHNAIWAFNNDGNLQLPPDGALVNSGNISLQSNGYLWTFDNQGRTVLPVLSVVRGDTSGGTITGFTLNIGDGTNEAIITTPDATSYNAQRLVINPGKGADGTGGEGGDIYLWAGRGGDTNGNGGDIKIRGGYGPGNGQGGYIRIESGDVAGNGVPGYVYIKGGDSGGSSGGYLDFQGGQGFAGNGGYINIQGGAGSADGGAVTIQGGISALGLAHYGNVQINAGANQWKFANNSTLYFPAKLNQQQNVYGTTTQVRGLPYPGGYFDGVGDIWTASAPDVVGADLLVRAHGDNGSAAETTTEISRISVVKDAWDLAAQPSITVYGQVNSNATIALTTYDASTNGSNLLVITGNTIPHGSGRYFTYTVTEFKRTVD